MDNVNLYEQDLIKVNDRKNYKFGKPDSDIRGWRAYSSDKKNIGVINEMIVDPESTKVHYVEVRINNDIRTKSSKREVIIPIHKVQLDIEKEIVYLTNVKTITSLIMLDSKGDYKTNDNNKTFRRSDNNIYTSELFDESIFHNHKERRLYKVKEFDTSQVFNKNPDIREWVVSTSDNINIGIVNDLLIDKELNKICYIDIKIDEGPIFNKERHVLVPIGLTVLKPNESRKIIIKMDVNEFINYPEYKGENVTEEYENFLLDIFNGKNKYDYSEEYPEFDKDNYSNDKNSY